MVDVVWERDNAGTFVGSSYVYTTPRDLAKFGFLFLHAGVWEGQRILPEGWVGYSTTIAPAYYQTRLKGQNRERPTYGAQWWLNQGIPEIGKVPFMPDVPEDTFMAKGHWGQYLYIIPSLNLIVTYTADNRDKTFDENHFLKSIIESIE